MPSLPSRYNALKVNCSLSNKHVDLNTCDREPIHIPGSIQSHGCLIACDSNLTRVERASENAPMILGHDANPVGRSVADVVGHKLLHDLRNALMTSSTASRPALLLDMTCNGHAFDIAIHHYKSTVIIEFEPAPAVGQPLHIAREMIGRISDIADVDRLVQRACRIVAGATGYDRVMIYRFEQDGSGKVVSETKRADLESFLGQYFPASDIPQQARMLYLKNTIRIIADASGERVPVNPVLDASGEPLDLSFAHLRSVSPIHCEYLRNMGVAASMSISIILDGKLWGLIACHHYSPRALPMAQRVAMEVFGEFFSLHLKSLKERRRVAAVAGTREALDRFLILSSHHDDVGELLRQSLREFSRLLPNDGLGLMFDGQWTGLGVTPPDNEIPLLLDFIGTVSEGRIWATHALSQRLPAAGAYGDRVSGLLAIPLSQTGSDCLLVFRRELVQTLDWAGNPDKTYETGPLGDRLTPRKSFAIWKETVKGQSQAWTEAEREIAEIVRVSIVEIVLRQNELMAGERHKSEVRQRMLNQELSHRVKNILAVIKSLVKSPQHHKSTLEDYVATLQGRIEALSVAHDQVVRGDGGGILADLLEAELQPYRVKASTVRLSGPPVWLDSRAFSVMALVVHELATNAAKYGALSVATGAVEIAWTMVGETACEIRWLEHGGPIVHVPSRNGFGSALIERSVPYDLNGESSIRFEPAGLEATFKIPAPHIKLAASSPAARAGMTDYTARTNRLGAIDPSILIVEDQILIALDLEGMLADAGLLKVATTSSVKQAIAQIEISPPDLAVLDINLGQTNSFAVAEELRKRGTPFVFATGYGEGADLPQELAGVPIVRKPFSRDAVVGALSSLMDNRRSGSKGTL
ncbi:HWE histidine kinase domain-containing protein [Rhizobium sp. S96]|uniref:HWE histidine kinase domain-containing protein n=1 Tax=Rhizobium sp. S96 TaxID=3055140 RepID=UPI0025AA3CA7|nr:HWE histidine kinase domain-containing protein [Rhizobium sp. S96]MDM9623302.1 HWE histidine kinase domain-containing protein [Rhizobium sp. S96]